ncbi:SDR family NAD(P)-dependent oxidoreductase [Peredibacter starrii]|uniref:SDR family NAD(P)-dependent oxidoreductase n=1 Tax=Peredibacter starrii TaxID=28202 RepID=A0AAX4HJC8_9BACT|nr:SDR family NAD(P)-dependent oxidoreductase [Peredibacter starrii]WPU63327.1 SDR family NAD(P)-dependent oxidoreductase [Peredibacter starrii]
MGSHALYSLKNSRVLITGASSGIGRAMAFSMAMRGAHLFLLARREEKLLEVKSEIQTEFPNVKVDVIACDVNDSHAVELIKKITEEKVDVLVNNAGLALGREKLELSQLTDMEQMISTNITANFKLVHLTLPWMLKAGKGDIINLCSVAGHYTYQGGAVYCATKHAVNAFTRVVREETAGKNIRVMQISPGMVNTEFSKVRFKGDQKTADSVYAGMVPLEADDIARMMTFMLEQPRHVVIDEIITMPTDQGSPTTVVRKHS